MGLFSTQENKRKDESTEENKFIQNLASQNGMVESNKKHNDSCLLPEDTFVDLDPKISLKILKKKGKRELSSSDEDTHFDKLKVNQGDNKSSSNDEEDEVEKFFPSCPTFKYNRDKRKMMFTRAGNFRSNLDCDNQQSSSKLKLPSHLDSDSSD